MAPAHPPPPGSWMLCPQSTLQRPHLLSRTGEEVALAWHFLFANVCKALHRANSVPRTAGLASGMTFPSYSETLDCTHSQKLL